jgi:hypothetical protein
MNLLVPAALIFALIIPIILLFYFMRPKRQERVVGSTLLWQQALQDLQASRPWQRLRITALLLLQLLAAIVIVLVLTRPAIFSNSPISGETVIVLQASASMQATDVSPSRFEQARHMIADFIDTLGPNDHLSLVSMARTPQVLTAISQDKNKLQNALNQARVTNQDADLEQALNLAFSLVQGRANAQIVVIGDGHVLNAQQQLIIPVPVRYLKVGTDAPNVALQALTSRTQQNKLIAFAQVANYSKEKRSLPVELYADNKLVGVQNITLVAGATGSVQWDTVPTNTRSLHARLLFQDVLNVDQEAWALVGSSIQGRVLLVTTGNRYLQTALRLQSNVSLFETTPDKYAKNDTYDLTIFDGFIPPALPAGAIFFINPPKGNHLFGTAGDEIAVSNLSPGNDTLNLLANVNLASIKAIKGSHALKPVVWQQPVINALQTPLLTAGEQDSKRVAVLGFDLHASDLPLQSSFPILIRNLINWFLPPPVSGDAQVTPGLPITIQPWPGTDKVTIVGPDQHSTLVGPPITPYTQTNQTGIYQVTEQVRGQNLQGAFVVNLFNPNQSKLAPAGGLPVLRSSNFTNNDPVVSHELREIWPWVAGALLLILCVEWWLFSRSYRQQAGSRQSGTVGQSRKSTGRLTQWQQRLTERYGIVQKRWLKKLKRTRGKIVGPTTKGKRNANV